MKCLLINPPQTLQSQPSLSIACLAAYLKKRNVRVKILDLNLESYYYFLDKTNLSTTLNKLIIQLNKLKNRKKLTNKEYAQIKFLNYVKNQGDYILNNIEKAVHNFKDKSCFYQPREIRWAYRVINWALELTSSIYYPTRVSIGKFKMNYNVLKSNEIICASKDDKKNPYINFFEESISEITEFAPDVIGFSILAHDQLIPSVTMARLIKNASPGFHITAGGAGITGLKDKLKLASGLFQYFDSFIFHEGEEPLYQLIAKIASSNLPVDVPGIMFLKGEKVYANKKRAIVQPDNLPVPDFSDFPLNLYLTPELVLPVRSSTGCYWHQCTFCSRYKGLHGTKDPFIPKRAAKIVEDMTILSEKYGTNKFFITDEGLKPEILKNLSKALIDKGTNFEWYSVGRFSPNLDQNTCIQAFQSGCRKLFMSIESGSNRILKLMGKGTSTEIIYNNIKDLIRAGIVLHLNVIVGFPTETMSELKETESFLKSLIPAVDHPGFSYAINKFTLLQKSKIAEEPGKYSVNINLKPDGELALHYDFTVDEGIDANLALAFKERLDRDIENQLIKSVAEIRNDSLYSFLYSCYSSYPVR